MTAIHGRLKYAALIIPVLLLLAPLTLAAVPQASDTKDLSATAPTSINLLKNTTYVVRNDMAVLINGTVDMTVTYGSAVLTVKGVNNITLTAGDVINVSKDVLATLMPISSSNMIPMAATIASFTLDKSNNVRSVTLSGGEYWIEGHAVSDPYARYLIVTEDTAPPNAWWKTSVSNVLVNSIVGGSFRKHFTVDSGSHTVYVGISIGTGQWVIKILSASTDNYNSNTPAPTPAPADGTTTSSQKQSSKWLIPAVAGAVIVVIVIAILFAATAQQHHKK